MSIAQILNSDLVTQYRGMIVRQGLEPNSCLLAQADSQAHAALLLGTRLGDVADGNSGPLGAFASGMVVRLEGTATAGDSIYLSASAGGVGTNVAPAYPVLLGKGYNVYQEDGIWYAQLLVQSFSESPYDLSCYVAGQPEGTGVQVFGHVAARSFKLFDIVGTLATAAAADAVWTLKIDDSSVAELHWTTGSAALTLVWTPPAGGYDVTAGSTITLSTTTGDVQPSDIAVTMKGVLS